MVNLGISEGFHDAGVTVLNSQEIVYASHSERYSRIKNDKWISKKQIPISYRHTAFYESPFLKNTNISPAWFLGIPVGFALYPHTTFLIGLVACKLYR